MSRSASAACRRSAAGRLPSRRGVLLGGSGPKGRGRPHLIRSLPGARRPGHGHQGEGVMTAALQIDDVAVCFGGVQAVDGVTFAIEAGDFVGLIGPNGAGKTTLIRIVAGVVRADRGRVLLDGQDLTGDATAS